MSEMEEKLSSILGNPQMMQQIMSMAQALGQSQPQEAHRDPPPKPETPEPPSFSGLDPGMLQKLSGLTKQSGMDQNQQALLRALSPYISRERCAKREKAMRAAKIARAASVFLNSGGLQLLSGR